MLTARVEPIDRSLQVVLTDDLSPEGRSAALARFARDQLADAQAINGRALGRVPDHETFVDGRPNAVEEQVRPDGVILYEFDLLLNVFAWVGAQLVEHSPFRTGRYQDSHLFFADGVQIEPGLDVPPAEEYVFMSAVPYARKIERGLSPQAPDGVYQAVATLARKRFGNVARVRFSYRPLHVGGVSLAGAPAADRRAARSQSQPAIIITL